MKYLSFWDKITRATPGDVSTAAATAKLQYADNSDVTDLASATRDVTSTNVVTAWENWYTNGASAPKDGSGKGFADDGALTCTAVSYDTGTKAC